MTQQVKIESILIDNLPINPKTFSLALVINSNPDIISQLPPISISKSDRGGYKIKDGRHRVAAFKLLGLIYINARICVDSI